MVWVDVGVLFVMMDGVVILVAMVLTRLGAPDDEWPSRTRTMDYSVRDHVFARAGLTLSVGRSLAEPPGPDAIVVAYFYEPTTVADYVDRLGGKDEWVRRFER